MFQGHFAYNKRLMNFDNFYYIFKISKQSKFMKTQKMYMYLKATKRWQCSHYISYTFKKNPFIQFIRIILSSKVGRIYKWYAIKITIFYEAKSLPLDMQYNNNNFR